MSTARPRSVFECKGEGTDQTLELISKRTKEALAAAKARGTRLGNPQIGAAGIKGTERVKAQADRFAANVLPIIHQAQAAGASSLRGIRTARGGTWATTQVSDILRSASTLAH